MNLINLSGSNYQGYTEQFAWYYHLIRNELFKLEKKRVMDVIEVYNVSKIIIIMKITNK